MTKQETRALVDRLNKLRAGLSAIAIELRHHYERAADVALRGLLHRLITVCTECARNMG